MKHIITIIIIIINFMIDVMLLVTSHKRQLLWAAKRIPTSGTTHETQKNKYEGTKEHRNKELNNDTKNRKADKNKKKKVHNSKNSPDSTTEFSSLTTSSGAQLRDSIINGIKHRENWAASKRIVDNADSFLFTANVLNRVCWKGCGSFGCNGWL